MAVAIARTSVLPLSGSTPGFVSIGPFPAGLWIASLTISLNSDSPGGFNISPVLSRVAEASVAAHLNGRALLDVGETVSNGKAAVVLEVGADDLLPFVLPVGLLMGSGPFWLLVRAAHSNGVSTGRVIVSAMAVPFAGATVSRGSGDEEPPLGGPIFLPPRPERPQGPPGGGDVA